MLNWEQELGGEATPLHGLQLVMDILLCLLAVGAGVGDVSAVDEAIVARGEVVSLARGVFCVICWGVADGHVLDLQAGSDLRGRLEG